MLSLRELPRFALMNLPHVAVTLGQVGNVLDTVLFGFMDADGEQRRLSPAAILVLLTVAAVRLKLLRRKVVGTLDPGNLAALLGYKPRQMREALRELDDACLLMIDRDFGRVSQLWLAHELMQLPLRPHRGQSYPQGVSNIERYDATRRKNAALISKRAELDDNPLPPCGLAVPAAPLGPPRPPATATEEEETPRTAGPNGAPPARIATAAIVAPGNARMALAAAVALTNGDKRPRQQGAKDHSGARPIPSWWRQLLQLAGMGGPAPPS